MLIDTLAAQPECSSRRELIASVRNAGQALDEFSVEDMEMLWKKDLLDQEKRKAEKEKY